MRKIEKDRPLPDHTKLDYHECYAKIVLEELFPDQFTNLVLSDKPDLQDTQSNIGIEVTIAENSKTLEAENLYSKLPYVDEYIKIKNIERIKQCGATYENGILSSSGNDDFRLINQAINKKIKKLQEAEYHVLDEYQLFVFSSIFANDVMLKDELNYLLEREIVDYFKKIYILVPGALFCFNLMLRTYKVLEITSNKQYQQAQLARQMVEEGETDDKTRKANKRTLPGWGTI